jgi:hypothetical protein
MDLREIEVPHGSSVGEVADAHCSTPRRSVPYRFVFHLHRGLGSLGVGLVETARAQTVPKSLEEGGSDAAMKVRKNNWTVGVAGRQLSGTYMTFANELAEVLDDGDNLRVIPIVTYGAASNLDDLLYLRNSDVVSDLPFRGIVSQNSSRTVVNAPAPQPSLRTARRGGRTCDPR